jgi:ribose-phosphate pyrophosphokinase
LIDSVLTTNLVYQPPELLERPYYISVDLSKYISLIIDKLNHDASISDLLDPVNKISALVNRYKNK